MVTESSIELDVPDLHISAPLLDHPLLTSTKVLELPSLSSGWKVFTPWHFTRQKGQSDQVEYENIQLHTALHRGLSPIAQGKGIHAPQSYPTAISSGHLAASPPSLGEVVGDHRHS